MKSDKELRDAINRYYSCLEMSEEARHQVTLITYLALAVKPSQGEYSGDTLLNLVRQYAREKRW